MNDACLEIDCRVIGSVQKNRRGRAGERGQSWRLGAAGPGG